MKLVYTVLVLDIWYVWKLVYIVFVLDIWYVWNPGHFDVIWIQYVTEQLSSIDSLQIIE